MAQTGSTGRFRVGSLLMRNGIELFSGTGAPVNGSTGAGKAGIGSVYTRTSNGAEYVNTGTLASPTWSLVGTVADDSITTAKLMANVVTPAKLDVTVMQYGEYTISAADIVDTTAGKLGHANGQILLAGQGADTAIELLSAVLIYDRLTASYGGGGNVTVNWASGGAALTGLVSAANSIGAGGDKVVALPVLSTVGYNLLVNTGLNLVAASAFTNPGTAAGVVRMKLAYRVHTLGL